MGSNVGLVLLEFKHLLVYLRKNFCYGLVIGTANPVKKWIAGFGIQFNCCNSGSILAAIVLLLHEEVELVKAPHNSPILLLVIRKRLA
jgi:hypothetical protein